MIVYNSDNGEIIQFLQDDQDVNVYFQFYDKDWLSNLRTIHIDNYPNDLQNYKVVNDEIVKRSELEISEIYSYGKVFTEEERLIEKLKPTYDEIKKAEQTIEILLLLDEVL